jgi:F-box protein 11
MTQYKPSLFSWTDNLKISKQTERFSIFPTPIFWELQENLQTRQQLIQNGIRSRSQWFGLLKTEEIVSFEERFNELELLIQDYDNFVKILKQYKEAYQLFFVQVVNELRTFVDEQCQELTDAEQERLKLEKSLQDDETLLDLLKQQKLQILRSAFLLHRATQLLLKKIKLIEKNFQRLAQEQERQRELLKKIINRLKKYLKVSQLQKKINLIEENIQNLAEQALNFEPDLNKYFGAFQNWLQQVIDIDNDLSIKVEEIRFLIEDIQTQNSKFLKGDEANNLSETLIDFLVQAHLKQESLQETFQLSCEEEIIKLERFDFPKDFLKKTSVFMALDSIKNQVNTQLLKSSWALSCLVVSKQSNADYRTIQEAIDQAQPGWQILVHPGLYIESLIINKPLEILGEGKAQEIVIQSSESNCLLMQTDYAVVRNLTLQGNFGDNEEKSFVVNIPEGRLIIEDCYITASSLSSIVIHGFKTNPIIRRCQISSSQENGIWIHTKAQGLVEDCSIFNHGLAGIKIENEGNPIIRHCKIYQGENSGVLVSKKGKGLLENCQISRNINAGVEIREGGNSIISHCQIFEEKTSGILIHAKGQGLIENCDIFQNGLQGIAIEEKGNPVIYKCRIYQEKEQGIFIYNQGKGIIKNCEIFENGYAGVEIREGGNPFIYQCKIYQSQKNGILVSQNGKGIIKDCEIFDNANAGVNIQDNGNLSIRQCKIFSKVKNLKISGSKILLTDENSQLD